MYIYIYICIYIYINSIYKYIFKKYFIFKLSLYRTQPTESSVSFYNFEISKRANLEKS